MPTFNLTKLGQRGADLSKLEVVAGAHAGHLVALAREMRVMLIGNLRLSDRHLPGVRWSVQVDKYSAHLTVRSQGIMLTRFRLSRSTMGAPPALWLPRLAKSETIQKFLQYYGIE